MLIRSFQKNDKNLIVSYIKKTNVFSEDEVNIAVELIDIFLEDEKQTDYELYVFEDTDKIVQGYICIGKTPATEGTYDLYWIAVNPEKHKSGIGKQLLSFCEETLNSKGGNLIIAETSSTEKYFNTRKFYEATGFSKLVQIKNYYKTNDDLVVYGKYLKQ